jgi:hypothetical protein
MGGVEREDMPNLVALCSFHRGWALFSRVLGTTKDFCCLDDSKKDVHFRKISRTSVDRGRLD